MGHFEVTGGRFGGLGGHLGSFWQPPDAFGGTWRVIWEALGSIWVAFGSIEGGPGAHPGGLGHHFGGFGDDLPCLGARNAIFTKT